MWPRQRPRSCRYFYPRPPRGGRPDLFECGDAILGISIHALREEGDRKSDFYTAPASTFLSTPSARRATFGVSAATPYFSNFYPRPPRGGRQTHTYEDHDNNNISIHALREEGDMYPYKKCTRTPTISIHALREEGDRWSAGTNRKSWKFLSTPSARRATRGDQLHTKTNTFLSTPSARRATVPAADLIREVLISIHALREEGDHKLSPP